MSRNKIPTFHGLPIHEKPLPKEERIGPDWLLFFGLVCVLVLMLANGMLYAKQQGWW